jgi:hypothetical protein
MGGSAPPDELRSKRGEEGAVGNYGDGGSENGIIMVVVVVSGAVAGLKWWWEIFNGYIPVAGVMMAVINEKVDPTHLSLPPISRL